MKIIQKEYSLDRTFIDFPDDCSDAVIVFLNGCNHNCSDCHNLDFKKFIPFESYIVLEDILFLANKHPKTDKIVLSGGDPLHPEHIKETEELIRKLKEIGFKICIYTGYEKDFVQLNLTKKVDFIKCGVYINSRKQQSGKDNEKMVLASDNQNFYDGDFNKISENGILYWQKTT
jgi:anaerobic ribonucleoside-triphosphate reductase activating protein